MVALHLNKSHKLYSYSCLQTKQGEVVRGGYDHKCDCKPQESLLKFSVLITSSTLSERAPISLPDTSSKYSTQSSHHSSLAVPHASSPNTHSRPTACSPKTQHYPR